MAFWIVSGLLTLVVAALLLMAMLRSRAQHEAAPEYDVRVYRDQLAEVDRDLARGTLSEAEAQRVRTEVSRRLLEADRAARAAGPATIRAPRTLSLAGAGLTLALLGGAFAVYLQIGAPGYPDLPLAARIAAAEAARKDRPVQADAEAAAAASRPEPPQPDARFLDLMEQLRAALAENPADIQGLQLLARNEARLGDFAAAQSAQTRLIEARGAEASADDYANLADLMIQAAGGYVSPEAEAALSAALTRDPAHGPARYYYGLAQAQTGRPDLAFRIWRALLADSPADAPWRPVLERELPGLADAAGIRWSPPAPPGPSAEDMAAAADMAPEERDAMIRGMVEGLAARLASEGGPPEDWARLIAALGVLGDKSEASAIWTEAQTVFAANPDALDTIRAAAEQAGVAG